MEQAIKRTRHEPRHNKQTGNNKPFAVYTFRRESGGRWRLHQEDTFDDALKRAQSLYKTGRYRRIEVKKILYSTPHTGQRVKTVKILRPQREVFLKYGFYALICAGLLGFCFSLI